MKFSTLILVTMASAEDKKVPPRHPLERLDRLTMFVAEIFSDWYSWSPKKEKWILKFVANADRMGRNFKRDNQRCGFYDETNLPHGGPSNHRERRFANDIDRYNREDPFEGIQQITTGFRKWAERYLAACSGQKKHKYIVNRMNKWSQKLQDLLSEKPTTVSTTEQSCK